jgi:dTDP-4-amino-4,6-dideoxygalactose transaminase
MVNPTVIPIFSASRASANLDLIGALQGVLDKSWYVLGEQVNEFETEFSAYTGIEHCISVANGSDALQLALTGLGVGRGDRVVTVANAGFYASTAIYAVGAEPIYVDVSPETLTLDSDALQTLILLKPAAIIVTHLYGQLADIEGIVKMATAAGIPVVEDCAQAHGAQRHGKRAGSYGTVGCFSFYPTKNLGALGDGGAIVTNDPALAVRLRQLRQYGWAKKYEVAIPGGRNSRLDEIQAAILRVKLPLLDGWNAQRRSIAKRYNEAFSDFDLQLPPSLGLDYVAHLYVVRVKERADFAAVLKSRFIATDIHYPIADHHQSAYHVTPDLSLSVTEQACEHVISLPCFPGLSDEDVERVIDAVTGYFSGRK